MNEIQEIMSKKFSPNKFSGLIIECGLSVKELQDELTIEAKKSVTSHQVIKKWIDGCVPSPKIQILKLMEYYFSKKLGREIDMYRDFFE